MSSQQDSKPLLGSTPRSNGGGGDIELGIGGFVNIVGAAGDTVEGLNNTMVKYSNQNKKFWKKVYLALSIASWMTLFGLPAYSVNVEHMLFGARFAEFGDKSVELCKDSMMGFKINNGTDERPNLISYTRYHALNGVEPDVWCGVFPGNFFGAWPGVVQTAMFTLYVSTGTTMKLAFQCVAGTFCAVLNVFLMSCLFPMGAASPNYSEIVAWVDLIFVIFLLLASRADVNTMMMGICWTVCLMMGFMNPTNTNFYGNDPSPIPGINYDAQTTVVMVTCLLGVSIAIIATIVPRPLSNISHVHSDAVEIVKGIEVILNDALAYFCQEASDSKRFMISAKISALETSIQGVKGNLDDSYWETFDFGRYRRMRILYDSFNTTSLKSLDVLYLIQIAIMSLKFDGAHKNFAAACRSQMVSLKKETIACLNTCLACCADGAISSQEAQKIEDHVRRIEQRLVEFCQCYQKLMLSNGDYISDQIAPDSLFAFSLGNYCRVLQDWAADVSQFESREKASEIDRCHPLVFAAKSVSSMFDPQYMFSKESLRFTAMNSLPILSTFAIALYSNGSIFIQYASTMPATLAVLVTYDYGAVFFKNLQRLMGVTFGKTLPLLLISVVELMPCSSSLRLLVHAASIFAFYAVFTFMYYASDKWSTVGCLIGGFGCYTLFVPCSGGRSVDYGALYKAIAEVIVAMMIKMITASLFSRKEPRDLAVEALETTFEETVSGLKALFDKGLQDGGDEFEQGIIKAKAALKQCRELAPKCDPLLQVAPGLRTPFKSNLYAKALELMRLLLADMDMLKMSLKGHIVEHAARLKLTNKEMRAEETQERLAKEKDNIHWHVSQSKAWNTTIKQDVLNTMQLSFGMCIVILKHATEEPLQSKDVETLKVMSNLASLDGIADFYKEISSSASHKTKSEDIILQDSRTITQIRRARFMVYIKSLSMMTEHSASLAQACFKHMIYC